MFDDASQDHQRPFHTESGRIIFDKPPNAVEATRESREREAHEFARAQVKMNRRTTWFNGFLVLATFCTVGIGVWQNSISQTAANAAKSSADTSAKTLWELQHGSGASDTHTLAQQAVTQALQTTNLATDTHTLALEAGKQASASGRLAELTAKQVTLNQEVNDSQRATITVDLGQVIHPISAAKDGGMSFAFFVVLRNVGQFPATHVSMRFKPSFVQWGEDLFKAPPKRQADLCERQPSPDERLVPGNQSTIVVGGAEPRMLNYASRPDPSQVIHWPPNGVPRTDVVYPIIVGCVDYQSGAMPDRHQTGFIFELQEKSKWPEGNPGLIGFATDVPVDRVLVTKYAFDQGKNY